MPSQAATRFPHSEKGKTSARMTWDVCSEITTTFNRPSDVFQSDFHQLEQLVVTLYDRGSSSTSVGEARLELFAQIGKVYGAIPPSSAALRDNAKRAAYQAGII